MNANLYKNQAFPVIVQEEESGGYFVVNPALEGCYSQGDTVEEALKNIKEATELCLEEMAESQEDHLPIKNIGIHIIHPEYVA